MMKQESTLHAGRGATVTRTPLGFCVALGRPKRWEHPWQTRLHWLGDRKQWVATVRPGFVNGRAPIVRTTAGEALALARNGSFYAGLINARSGAADIRRAAELAGEGEAELQSIGPGTRIDVPLYNNPPVPLGWRAVGWGSAGGVGSAVPQFFRDRGVEAAPRSVAADAGTFPQAPARKPGSRLLLACDVVLHQPRLALTSSVEILPGIATGISNVTQTLGMRSAAPGDRLKVYGTPLWDPFYASNAGIDPLAGDYEEPPFDERLIATVFLLSPPDTEAGSAPDQNWQPWVRHGLFWNLSYQERTALRVPAQDNIFGKLVATANLLGGGTASIAVNFLGASLNDLNQNALNLLAAHSMAGTFWTATGGGHDGAIATRETTPAKPGLRKADALAARAAQAARTRRAQRLDPPFPYRAEPFDLALLRP